MKVFISLLMAFSSVAANAQSGYMFVFLNKKAEADTLSKEEVARLMGGHHAAREKLWREDKLLAAGPFEGGGGIYIMNSNNADEVEKWIATDPAIQAGRWHVEVLPFIPRYGGVCKVGEDYTMTNYHFVRFTPDPMKYNASRYPAIMKEHDSYLRELRGTGNVIVEAIFGEQEGGIIVMKGEVDRSVFDSDPGVKEGLIFLDVKRLYIAKGSFCEK